MLVWYAGLLAVWFYAATIGNNPRFLGWTTWALGFASFVLLGKIAEAL